jgi:hypothetical protein
MATRDVAKKRKNDLVTGYPLAGKGVVDEDTMYPGAVKRALKGTGEVERGGMADARKMAKEPTVKMGPQRGAIQRVAEPPPKRKRTLDRFRDV